VIRVAYLYLKWSPVL